ncbi:hypothetical protein M758_2G017800 [Ceratodon purpureus]|nr:hypothetical protein M758_2G017800 [Ceratodon purpureus]
MGQLLHLSYKRIVIFDPHVFLTYTLSTEPNPEESKPNIPNIFLLCQNEVDLSTMNSATFSCAMIWTPDALVLSCRSLPLTHLRLIMKADYLLINWAAKSGFVH